MSNVRVWCLVTRDQVRLRSGQPLPAPRDEADSFNSVTTAKQSSPPEFVAKTIATVAAARRPRARYASGSGAKPLIVIRGLLPDRADDSVVRRASGPR